MEQHQTTRSPPNPLRRTWVVAIWGLLGFVLLIAGLSGVGNGSTWDEKARSAFQRELSGLTREIQLEDEQRRSLLGGPSSSGLPAGMTAEQLQAYRRKLDEQRETAKVSWKLPPVAILGRGFDARLQVVFDRALFGGAEQRIRKAEGIVIDRSPRLESAERFQQMPLDRKVIARLRAPSFIVAPGERQTMDVGAEVVWRLVPKELGTHVVLITFEPTDADSSGVFAQSLPEQPNPPPIVIVVDVVPPATSLGARIAATASAEWLTLAGGLNLMTSLALALWLGRPRS